MSAQYSVILAMLDIECIFGDDRNAKLDMKAHPPCFQQRKAMRTLRQSPPATQLLRKSRFSTAFQSLNRKFTLSNTEINANTALYMFLMF